MPDKTHAVLIVAPTVVRLRLGSLTAGEPYAVAHYGRTSTQIGAVMVLLEIARNNGARTIEIIHANA